MQNRKDVVGRWRHRNIVCFGGLYPGMSIPSVIIIKTGIKQCINPLGVGRYNVYPSTQVHNDYCPMLKQCIDPLGVGRYNVYPNTQVHNDCPMFKHVSEYKDVSVTQTDLVQPIVCSIYHYYETELRTQNSEMFYSPIHNTTNFHIQLLPNIMGQENPH